MIKINLKTQIKILVIINILLIACIAVIGYLLFLEYQNTEAYVLTGNLEYLKEISDPENPEIGIYLKLYLEYLKYAKFGYSAGSAFICISNASESLCISINSTNNNEKDGFIIDLEDRNNNGVIDTEDIFHIYGRKINGYNIMFCISGISGNIHTHIS